MNDILIVASLIGALVLILGVQRLVVALVERDTRKIKAQVWDEAYRQGAEDERQAIEWDVPEYPTANRSNPYRKKN